MNIQIQSITLANFKGVRSLEIIFSSNVASIYGRNRSGKTTIADAINWCLFGKDSKGNTKFGIRTRDTDGNVIPDIDHTVEMKILCDQIPHTLKRSLRADGTYAYFIDGGKSTAGDYKVFISQFVGEETFKAITTPTYFTSLSWQEQRKFLSDMVGTISNEQIADGDHRFDELLGILSQTDIETHLKHLSYQIKQVKADLDRIPVRLEELNKTLPEKQEWGDLDSELKEKQQKLSELQTTLAQLQSGNADDAVKKSVRDKIAFSQKRLDMMERSARNMARELYDAHEREIRQAKVSISETESTLQAIDNKISANQQLVTRVQETIQNCEIQAKLIRQQWTDNKSARLAISDDEAYCPTCGQPLPEEQLSKKVEEIRANFAKRKKDKFDELTNLANEVKRTKSQAESDFTEYQSVISQSLATKAELSKTLPTLKANLEEIEQQPLKTWEEVLAENASYSQVKEEIKNLEASLDTGSAGNTTPHVSEIKQGIIECNRDIAVLQESIASKIQYEKVTGLINGVGEEKKNLIAQLDNLQRQEDLSKMFAERSNNLLESKVNQHFSFVQWKLFRELLNGNREPYCECYHNGVPYSDLNSADKINAGLDIINTLSGIYGISAPICIDNAESVNELLETKGQQIRLYVSEDNTLTIK